MGRPLEQNTVLLDKHVLGAENPDIEVLEYFCFDPFGDFPGKCFADRMVSLFHVSYVRLTECKGLEKHCMGRI